MKITCKGSKKYLFNKKKLKKMYFVYKNCDLIRKFKTKRHAVRMVKRLIKKSNQLHDLIEVMSKKHFLFYW